MVWIFILKGRKWTELKSKNGLPYVKFQGVLWCKACCSIPSVVILVHLNSFHIQGRDTELFTESIWILNMFNTLLLWPILSESKLTASSRSQSRSFWSSQFHKLLSHLDLMIQQTQRHQSFHWYIEMLFGACKTSVN